MATTARLTEYSVRPLQRGDIQEILKLQRKAGALYLPWTAGQLESHLRVFPEGQLVVEGEHVVAIASTLRLKPAPDEVPLDWRQATGNGYFHTHARGGDTLYLADVTIDPEADRTEVRQALDAVLFKAVQDWGLQRVLNACRLPEFVHHAGELTPEAYLRDVVRGRLTDPVVTALLEQGYRPAGFLLDLQNQPRAKEKLATLMEWHADVA
jgi:hypothetical protein